MPRVHERKAAKDYPDIGVTKGERYFTWKIKLPRGGLVRRSKTYPKRSQLTMSEFYGSAYDLDDQICDAASADDLRTLADEVRTLGEEQQEKLDNMPEGLQSSSSGELLTERAENCEAWATEIDSAADTLAQALQQIDSDEEEADDDTDRDFEADREDALQEARDASTMTF